MIYKEISKDWLHAVEAQSLRKWRKSEHAGDHSQEHPFAHRWDDYEVSEGHAVEVHPLSGSYSKEMHERDASGRDMVPLTRD